MSPKHSYLYVEDDPLSCEVMETLLLHIVGVKSLQILRDSRDFMAQVRSLETRPDFILLDIHIAPLDGYQVLRLLRQDPDYRDAKVLAVTASVMAEEVRQLRAAGFDGALAKPLDMATFPNLIARLEAGEQIWQVN